jgi:lactate dehydrogenase-like 2-hydroxyacid dehydrogenase
MMVSVIGIGAATRRNSIEGYEWDRKISRRQLVEDTNMPGVLEGKVALVTGISHDGQIGQAVARKLAESGAALVICARTQSNVEARAEECAGPARACYPSPYL